jgi:hypothetical protein
MKSTIIASVYWLALLSLTTLGFLGCESTPFTGKSESEFVTETKIEGITFKIYKTKDGNGNRIYLTVPPVSVTWTEQVGKMQEQRGNVAVTTDAETARKAQLEAEIAAMKQKLDALQQEVRK